MANGKRKDKQLFKLTWPFSLSWMLNRSLTWGWTQPRP